MPEQKISSHININLENELQFSKLFHSILDIRLPNYELKIIKVLRVLLCQQPIHKALATHIWVATSVPYKRKKVQIVRNFLQHFLTTFWHLQMAFLIFEITAYLLGCRVRRNAVFSSSSASSGAVSSKLGADCRSVESCRKRCTTLPENLFYFIWFKVHQ